MSCFTATMSRSVRLNQVPVANLRLVQVCHSLTQGISTSACRGRPRPCPWLGCFEASHMQVFPRIAPPNKRINAREEELVSLDYVTQDLHNCPKQKANSTTKCTRKLGAKQNKTVHSSCQFCLCSNLVPFICTF